MKGPTGCLWFALTLFVAAVLQQSLAYRLSIFGFHPDFLLLALGILAFGRPTSTTIALGFADGLLMGGLSGANMQHYIASRTLAGFFLGLVGHIQEKPTMGSTAAAVVATTLGAQILLMFLAPPHGIGGFLADTIRTAVYNGVLAISVFALLKRFTSQGGR